MRRRRLPCVAPPRRSATGAGTGIGKAVALALMKEACASLPDGGKTSSKKLPPRYPGAKSLVVPTDVADPGGDQGAVRQDQGKRSAGSMSSSTMPASARPLSRVSYRDWVVDTNLTGMFLCTQEAIKDHEGAGSARRPHRQQRLHLRARAATACLVAV